MRRLITTILMMLIPISAAAADAPVRAELARLREAYWALVTGPQWTSWDQRTADVNRQVMTSLLPRIKVVDRMFGDANPEVARGLVGLGGLPRGEGNLGLIKQRESLIAQFEQLDRTWKATFASFDPSWRDTTFGREFTRLTTSLLKVYMHLARRPDLVAERLAEWNAAADLLARTAPHPDLAKSIASLQGIIAEYAPAHGVQTSFLQLGYVISHLKHVEDLLDLGYGGCRALLGGVPVLPAPTLALPRPRAA